MSRHFWRACDREAGFSFVELLVTIIIAGIAFAAMVPVFVQAQKSNASDNSRNLALSIAQERIDKIRQLPYDQIVADAAHPDTSPNLYNGSSAAPTATPPGFADGQFGPTAVLQTGAGGLTRTFLVDYTVVPVPATAAPGQEQYKKVTVDVYWTGNPEPVKHTTLSTFIYRQYSGPLISTFTILPLQYVSATGGEPEYWYIPPATGSVTTNSAGYPKGAAPTVSMSAHIDASAINNTGKVDFRVLAHDGTEVLKRVVSKTAPVYPDTYSDGTYGTQWLPTGYRDGLYTFRATAFSAGIATQGPSWEVQYDLETGAPWAPVGLTGVSVLNGADNAIKLTWTPAQASDIDHYVLYRILVGAETFPTDFPAGATPVSGGSALSPTVAEAGFVDGPVVVGQTYRYRLLAVDDDGQVGDYLEKDVQAGVPTDAAKPSTPTNLAVAVPSNTQQVNLNWTESTDDVGVTAYRVYRSTTSGAAWPSGWAFVGQAAAVIAPTYSDTTVAWSQSYYYRVTAVDAAGNESDPSVVSPVATVGSAPVIPTLNLTVRVQNKTTVDAYVEVTNTATSVSYGAQKFRKNKTDSQTWTALPQGNYRLTVSQNGTIVPGKTQDIFLTSLLPQPIDLVVP